MSPPQVRRRLDEISGTVDVAADLVRDGEMTVRSLPDNERFTISELLRAVADRLEGIAGELHDLQEAS